MDPDTARRFTRGLTPGPSHDFAPLGELEPEPPREDQVDLAAIAEAAFRRGWQRGIAAGDSRVDELRRAFTDTRNGELREATADGHARAMEEIERALEEISPVIGRARARVDTLWNETTPDRIGRARYGELVATRQNLREASEKLERAIGRTSSRMVTR